MLHKCRAVLGLLVLMMFVATPSAQAHGQLVDSNPAANSQVLVLPEKVRLEFDDKLQVFEGKTVNVLVVEDSYGKQIDAGDSIVAGAVLTVTLRDRSEAGKFHVSYRIVSDDGHPVAGDYYFTVAGAPSAVPSPSAPEAVSTAAAEVSTTGLSSQDSFWTRYQGRIFLGFFVVLAVLTWWLMRRRR